MDHGCRKRISGDVPRTGEERIACGSVNERSSSSPSGKQDPAPMEAIRERTEAVRHHAGIRSRGDRGGLEALRSPRLDGALETSRRQNRALPNLSRDPRGEDRVSTPIGYPDPQPPRRTWVRRNRPLRRFSRMEVERLSLGRESISQEVHLVNRYMVTWTTQSSDPRSPIQQASLREAVSASRSGKPWRTRRLTALLRSGRRRSARSDTHFPLRESHTARGASRKDDR